MSKYSQDEYAMALKQLMPKGIIWGDRNSIQYRLLMSIAKSFQRIDDEAINLITSAFPGSSITFLDEWEKSLGLPDSCSFGEKQTYQDRLLAVFLKFISIGGQSKSYFTELASALSKVIKIKEFRQARCGLSRAGDRIYGEEWPFVWQVLGLNDNRQFAKAGMSRCGDPLMTHGNSTIECRLDKYSPSHTILQFIYD
ncbi:DUF2313 domain-containing protein (plasmid) [Orbus sturtevantii]|uniref:YmfQ family protein n=1 Tax=Orbus sturtevantii TaxID=3074109 RepID=UPI00370D7CC0